MEKMKIESLKNDRSFGSELKNMNSSYGFGVGGQITSMPIIFLPKECEGYLPGAYSIDIYHKKMVLIEDNISIVDSREQNIIVAFYLNIDLCVALEGIKGFVYGIEEVGVIVGKLREKFETKNVELDISRRAFSRSLGINIRKCSLIEVFAI